MSEPVIHYVQMPRAAKYPEGYKLPLKDRVLVVVGANGSGKTRFGAWLDRQNPRLHHRVSAHRSLIFPDQVQPTDLQQAELRLFTGFNAEDKFDIHKQHTRWQNQPEIALLNDYELLITVMVSESFEVSDKYRVQMLTEHRYFPPPKTRLDMVKHIWEQVLPARELVISGSRIQARNRQGGSLYHAKAMSDGERGIFHLIGEALSVPKNGTFIVDEPELHLHRAIQARLWDAVELARPDCTFVYITHDLGFAASRKDATKVWLREYGEGKWDWELVPEVDAFPEALLLEVIGSRQPILFVEGHRESLDYFVYQKLYPGYSIMPCGSCENVIHSTRSFAALNELHHNSCHGLVDNDGRAENEIRKLESLGVQALPVAIVENLFLTEPVLRLASEKLGRNPEETIPQVQARVFDLIEKEKVRVVSNLTRQELETKVRLSGKGEDGAEALTAHYTSTLAGIDPKAVYLRWETEVTRVLEKKDYSSALCYYKTKGLASIAGSVFGLKYHDQIMHWLRSKEADGFIAALRSVVPIFKHVPENPVATKTIIAENSSEQVTTTG